MIFLVSIEMPIRGSYVLGQLSVSEEGMKEWEVRQLAEKKVVEMLVSIGFLQRKIGIQVADYSTLEGGFSSHFYYSNSGI